MNLENQSSKKTSFDCAKIFCEHRQQRDHNQANVGASARLEHYPRSLVARYVYHGWSHYFRCIRWQAREEPRYASTFGGLFDRATDAIFVSTGAWALAAVGLINPWLWP